MTEPQALQSVEEPQSPALAAEGVAPEAEPETPPEPWTPARVREWNDYFDVYVMLAALLLVFLVSCNHVTDSHLWMHLQTGQVIRSSGAPVTTDNFSYTRNGAPWVNLPWLFQWAHAALYDVVSGLVPVNPADPTANRAGTEQIAIGALVVLSAIVRLLTAWVLLKIRHPGPGLWWSALCVILAFGVVYHPLFGILLGGMSEPGFVGPSTWAQLLLALELLVLFRAFCRGRGGALWLLLPIFALWANIDDSFLTGLLVLAAAAVGRLLDGGVAVAFPDESTALGDGDGDGATAQPIEKAPTRRAVSTGTAFVVLALSALACLANPFIYRAYSSALEPYLALVQPAGTITTTDHLSFFGKGLRESMSGFAWYFQLYYLVAVAVGIASFLLNARRFLWSRFLPYAVLAVIWGFLMRADLQFGMLLATVLALNGQEWYLDRFGREGKLGTSWAIWSTAGRLITLGLVTFVIIKDITGWRNVQPRVQFGVGFRPDDFAFDAADFLNNHNEIKGNIFNTSTAQGDVLIWKTGGRRKTYYDGRPRFYPQELLEEWQKTRRALSSDEKETWKPLLDKYHISAILIEPGPGGSPNTYRTLMQSPNWVPFYDDGQTVMFGRADAPASDLAVFEANRLKADLRAYHSNRPVPGAERPPNPTSWMDEYFQGRTFSRPQSRTESARRWLEGLGSEGTAAQTEPLPDPARCLLAIQEARIALASSPDDWIAFRRLKDAYKYLMQQEAAMLAGIPITPDNQDRIRALNPNIEQLMSRYRQRVTNLNFAIETTPAPSSAPARRELQGLNLELYQLYMSANAKDLARDRLQKAIELNQEDELPAETIAQLRQALANLNQQVKQIEDKLEDLAIERQLNQVQQAAYAMSQGAPGIAITQFADAEQQSVSPAVVKPQLVDLYCTTGQPDKALELLAVGSIDDPNLGTQPGASPTRQGTVYFLLGNYMSAATLWQDRAIPRLRFARSERALNAAAAMIRGEAIQSSNALLTLPGTLTQQASWEYDLAMCKLEGGQPEDAAEHFTKALTLAPDLVVRPIAAYYLDKIGKPVPPPSKRPGAPAAVGGVAASAPSGKPALLAPTSGSVPPAAGSPKAGAASESVPSTTTPLRSPEPKKEGTEEKSQAKVPGPKGAG
jgi:tetratricopeptide (TPR) repeat protein